MHKVIHRAMVKILNPVNFKQPLVITKETFRGSSFGRETVQVNKSSLHLGSKTDRYEPQQKTRVAFHEKQGGFLHVLRHRQT